MIAALDARLQELQAHDDQISRQSQDLVARQQRQEAALRRNVAVFADGQGRPRTVALADVVRAYQPNAMGLAAKVGHYLAKIWELLTAKPRESNTEGGLFPPIFGTVMLDLPHGDKLLSPGRAGGHLPGRIRPRGHAGAPGAHRREQPRRHPLDRLWDLRPGVFRLRRRQAAGRRGSIRSGWRRAAPRSAPAASSGPA